MAGKPSVLMDLNILLDVLQKRLPFYEKFCRPPGAVETGRVHGFIAAHSLTTLFYLFSKTKTLPKHVRPSPTCCSFSRSPRWIKVPLSRHSTGLS